MCIHFIPPLFLIRPVLVCVLCLPFQCIARVSKMTFCQVRSITVRSTWIRDTLWKLCTSAYIMKIWTTSVLGKCVLQNRANSRQKHIEVTTHSTADIAVIKGADKTCKLLGNSFANKQWKNKRPLAITVVPSRHYADRVHPHQAVQTRFHVR